MQPRNRILVSSNCMTAGIALGLKALLPNTVIEVAHITTFNGISKEALNLRLEGFDLWVTGPLDPEILVAVDRAQVLRIPRIVFNAYHPDIVYALDDKGVIMKGAFGCDYHSALVLWAYRKGLTLAQTIALFRTDVFAKLGYQSNWSSALDRLQKIFEATDIDIGGFYPAVLEHAPFMHSHNHPVGAATCLLAKLIAVKITDDASLMKRPIERAVQDTLATGAIWPIYPGIAEQYGLMGDYLWKFGPDRFVQGVEDFAAASFTAYEAQDPARWHCPALDEAFLDQALGYEGTAP